jgi:hypothetical protein
MATSGAEHEDTDVHFEEPTDMHPRAQSHIETPDWCEDVL